MMSVMIKKQNKLSKFKHLNKVVRLKAYRFRYTLTVVTPIPTTLIRKLKYKISGDLKQKKN